MLSQSGYSKQIIGFNVEYKFEKEDDEYGEYTKLHIINIADDININENTPLDLLDATSNLYNESQKSYIERYQKFSKWLESNIGKKFIAIIPAFVTNGSRFTNMPEIYVYHKKFYFDRFVRSNNSISFLTDCQLIEVDKNLSNKALLNIAHSIIMARITQPFMDMDYHGRSVT